MNISSFHIQHVIKAYGQRLGRRSLGGLKFSTGTKPSPDMISISTEAKRRQVMDQITQDIVSKAKGQSYNIDDKVIERLGEKFGGAIDIIPSKNKAIGFKFRILTDSDDSVGTIKELSLNDLQKIVENLYSDEIHDGE